VRDYLETEGVPLVNEDVGDTTPRKVAFFPATGRALVKRLRTLHNDTLVRREQAYRNEIVRQPVAGEVELF
jgi:chemotaxis protein CheD